MRPSEVGNLLVKSILFLILLLSNSLAWAQLATIGREELQDPKYKPSGSVFELKLPKAKDQGDAEECFLFAYVTQLETSLYNSVHKKDQDKPTLSVPYLLARKIQYHVEQTLEYGESSTVLRGGQVYDAVNIAQFYGIVPEESWQPKVAYKNWPTEELYDSVTKKLKSWKVKLERLKESEGEKSAIYKDTLAEAKADTLKPLWDVTGILPVKVTYQGKSYSPQQLSKKFGADRRKEINMMYPPTKWSDENLNYFLAELDAIINSTGGSYALTPTEWNQTLEQIKKNVDSGIATLIGISWDRSGHMLNVVGYAMTEGEITHIKAINSWGNSWGKNGAAWFTVKDFAKKYDQIWWFQ